MNLPLSNPIEDRLLSTLRIRWLVVALLLFFLFSLLLIQFYRIQVCEGSHWSEKASQQHFLVVKEPARRGTFFCRADRRHPHTFPWLPLVMEIEKYHLHVDPLSLPPQHRESFLQTLRSLLHWDQAMYRWGREQLEKIARDRTLAVWLDKEVRTAIEEWWLNFAKEMKIPRNALFFVIESKRVHPFGSLLGQVLHTVQERREGKQNSSVPTGGLEWFFHEFLEGKEGKKRYRRSPRHSFETGEILVPPTPGADIFLTIDLGLQAIVESAIERGVKKSQARAGWAVMMDPKSGEILALAQYPSFPPDEYAEYFNDPKKIIDTKIRAATDALEPGSVMKAITVALALEANRSLEQRGELPLFDPEEKIPTANGHFPGRRKPICDVGQHHFLNMDMAIKKSSNIYVARLAERIVERMGKEWYRDRLQNVFGFGSKTGIELPSETAGVLPTPGKKHPNGKLEWSTPTPFSLAMGYNIQVNTFQLLRAFALLVNGGYLVRPTLLDHLEMQNDEELVSYRHASPERQLLDPKIARRVVQAMKYGTKKGGNGRRGAIPGYTEFGKTSTEEKLVNGQYDRKSHYNLFIGGACVDDPPFIVAIVMDEPMYGVLPGIGRIHHGGISSAPIFRHICQQSLAYLGIPPDDPYGYPEGDPRYDPTKADWVKETEALQEKYELWNSFSSK